MLAKSRCLLVCKPSLIHLRKLCSLSDKSAAEAAEMKILKASIEKTVDKNPDLATASFSSEHYEETGSRGVFPHPLSVGASDLAEFEKMNLSKENVFVDTYALVKVFTEKGFTLQQAESLTYTFTHLMNNALREQRKFCVEKAALDVMREQMMAHIGALRKDMVILEKSELSDLRNENEKLKHLFAQHKSMIGEEVSTVKNQLTLDINMERSRTKDDQSHIASNITDLNTRLVADIGSLQTTFERYKNDIYKFIVGSVLSGITVGLGVYRIMKP